MINERDKIVITRWKYFIRNILAGLLCNLPGLVFVCLKVFNMINIHVHLTAFGALLVIFIGAGVLMIVDIIFLSINLKGQRLVDKILGTQIVNENYIFVVNGKIERKF